MSSVAISPRWAGSRSFQSSGGNVRRSGGGTADHAQGLGEGDRVWVEVRGGGGSGGERADRVVHDQGGPDLLVHQVGELRAQYLPRSAEVGFQLVVRCFFLPPL